MATAQQPIELILARSLMSNLSTPAFLVDPEGVLVFYNDAAAELLGLRFEEAGEMEADDWGTRFGPFDAEGERIPVDDLPLAIAVREGQPSHTRFRIRSTHGEERDVEVTAFPIVASAGLRGALAIFWQTEES